MYEEEELHIITEVGVFEGLDITDPTAKKVKKKSKEEMEALIEQSIKTNKEALDSSDVK